MALSLRNVALQKNVALLKCIKTRSVVTSANKNQSPPPILAAIRKETNKQELFSAITFPERNCSLSILDKTSAIMVFQSDSCPTFTLPETTQPSTSKTVANDTWMASQSETSIGSNPECPNCKASSPLNSASVTEAFERLASSTYVTDPCPPCPGTCCCACNLPPPCKTMPKCLQFMTGYYYYPYGTWFCGPYHVDTGAVPYGCPKPAEVKCCCGVLGCNVCFPSKWVKKGRTTKDDKVLNVPVPSTEAGQMPQSQYKGGNVSFVPQNTNQNQSVQNQSNAWNYSHPYNSQTLQDQYNAWNWNAWYQSQQQAYQNQMQNQQGQTYPIAGGYPVNTSTPQTHNWINNRVPGDGAESATKKAASVLSNTTSISECTNKEAKLSKSGVNSSIIQNDLKGLNIKPVNEQDVNQSKELDIKQASQLDIKHASQLDIKEASQQDIKQASQLDIKQASLLDICKEKELDINKEKELQDINKAKEIDVNKLYIDKIKALRLKNFNKLYATKVQQQDNKNVNKLDLNKVEKQVIDDCKEDINRAKEQNIKNDNKLDMTKGEDLDTENVKPVAKDRPNYCSMLRDPNDKR